ncbi:MAG TPA: DegT/DnrJ/EryC1/StrS family aminotransferase [Thermoanaerobaculia bacterium]|nr:DegT/DnrJ/EryC1/StrS family aminotransferase [Thermoanaerobaculia bacterium]
MRIPHFDLKPAAAELAPELLARWSDLLARTSFVGGAEVESFEKAFADYLGGPDCVAVANGTDALVVALHALGLRPGDEVLVPSLTFFATAEAVVWAGGVPGPVDVDAASFNVDVADAEARATSRTVGMIPVHLYGQPCDLDAALALCGRRGWWLIEDAAQAHGATWRGRKVGTFGALAGWSFYPSKNLGCFGDGGAVTGADTGALARVRTLANHGRLEHYRHGAVGTNSRLDALQAAVLNLRLTRLERDNARRAALVARYRESLAGVGDLRFAAVPAEASPVWHQLTVRTAARDGLRQHLLDAGIGSATFYPIPLHQQPALVPLLPAGLSLPASEAAAREVLCLPLYPQLSESQVDEVCDAVRGFYGD